tara:strand:+ start:5472 stop:6041 length:570 start_codon:yes stop_codon:yes gene_type:complete
MARSLKKKSLAGGRLVNPVSPIGGTALKSGPTSTTLRMKVTKVKQAYQHFSDKHYSVSVDNNEIVEEAQCILSVVGCSILDMPSRYSLMQDQTDKEVLQNIDVPIFQAAELKPMAISAINNMGNNSNDPFWNLDMGPLLATKNLDAAVKKPKQQKQFDASQIAAELVSYNESSLTTTLAPFLDTNRRKL